MRLDTSPLRDTAPARPPGSTGPLGTPAAMAPAPSISAARSERSVSVDVATRAAGAAFNGERVEAIRTAIADGTYPVDPHRTATALIAGQHLAGLRP